MEHWVDIPWESMNEDWIKTMRWGWPHIKTLDDYPFRQSRIPPTPEEKAALEESFRTSLNLPSSIPMPDSLRREINEYFGKKMPNQNFQRKARHIEWLVETYFDEEAFEWEHLRSNIVRVDATFVEDLTEENQVFFQDMITRPNPQMMRDLARTWERHHGETLDEFLVRLRLDGMPRVEQAQKLEEYMAKDEGKASPDSVRRKVSEFLGKPLPNPWLEFRVARAVRILRSTPGLDKRKMEVLVSGLTRKKRLYFSDLPLPLQKLLAICDRGEWRGAWWNEVNDDLQEKPVGS